MSVRPLAALLLLTVLCHAAIVIDASKPAGAPAPLPFPMGGRSPDGHTLGVNSRYLTMDGKPWFPVMGEFQYSRYPAQEWEREILKMKAGGIRIISTYVFWIHHEEMEGRFDWSDRRDLRHFVELAGRHGMFVWARIGPWDHGEVRNGGLPDWVLRNSPVRRNDPVYLKSVRRFYGEIGRQLRGLFWQDGGPVIGVQIENEYHERGPGCGEEHILTLKRLAQDAGIRAPFYSVTGWDEAAVPPREVLPVFGGYPDGFWYRSLDALPPSPNYFFTPIRCEENVGDDLCPKRPEIDRRFTAFPFFTAEMGGGMAVAYHRRPVMSADDIAALDIVKLGSGVTMYGYYMFHGGTNPDGKQATLQESQATGYPQDLPVKNYDFQAPLGEFGQVRESYRDLKTVHLFLQDFGSNLAPMTAYFPAKTPTGKLDRKTPRVALRANGAGGFLFLNSYQKDHPLPAADEFQVEVKLPSGAVTVPRRPITLPGGAYTFWPVRMPVGGAVLEYATAQPVCRLQDPDTLVFFAWPGITPEFVFRDDAGLSIEAPDAEVVRERGVVSVAGSTGVIRIRPRQGSPVQILLLSRDQARNIWKAPLAGRERLILSAAALYFEGGRAHLSAADAASLEFGIFPHLARTPTGFRRAGSDGIFERYAAEGIKSVALEPTLQQLAKAGAAPEVKMGQDVAVVPPDSSFALAARWSVHVPDLPGDTGQVLLRINYQGDIARLYAGDRLIADDFYHGVPWEIGLRGIPAAELTRGLELKILPWRADAPIFIGNGLRPGSQAATVTEIRAVPEYRAVADLGR